MTPLRVWPTTRQMAVAVVCLLIVLGGAFVAASATQDKQIFSLSPPRRESTPPDVPEPADLKEEQRLDLHRTFFTAWAALILVTPAFCAFLFRRTSETAAGYWLAFWTVGLVAFLVHFYWAVVVIFGNDWGLIRDTTRVTIAITDTVFTVWWVFDVLLAWLVRTEKTWIRIQRGVVHLLAFVLFFLGSVKEGETPLSRALGIAMGVAVLTAFLIWCARRLKKRDLAVADAAS